MRYLIRPFVIMQVPHSREIKSQNAFSEIILPHRQHRSGCESGSPDLSVRRRLAEMAGLV